VLSTTQPSLRKFKRALVEAENGPARLRERGHYRMFFALPSHKVDLIAKTSDIAVMSENPLPPETAEARYNIGDVVRHRIFDFRGVVFDIDPVFANSEEWYESIPEAVRPAKNQPFYHLFAENSENSYIAYVSQQNLLPDTDAGPVNHPAVSGFFGQWSGSRYEMKREMRH
jgi:heat shock protein HspQ